MALKVRCLLLASVSVICLALTSASVKASELMLGLSSGYRELTISDSDNSSDLAKLKTKGAGFMPSISINGTPNFIANTQWGWTYSSNLMFSSFTRQIIDDDSGIESIDKGTRVSGVSLFFNPVIYYQFTNTGSWQWRLGGDFGLGYQNHRGNFVVTDENSDHYGETEKLRVSGIGASAGVYAELSYGRHHLRLNGDEIMQLDKVKGDDFSYRYSEVAVFLTYSYSLINF